MHFTPSDAISPSEYCIRGDYDNYRSLEMAPSTDILDDG